MNVLLEAKKIWPGLSQSDLEIALWSLTTYPAGKPEDVLRDLQNAYSKSGGDYMQALYLADEQRSRLIGTCGG